MALRDVLTVAQAETARPVIQQPLVRQPPVLNMRGEKVGLGPLQPELLSTYERWLNDFDLLSMLDRRFRPLTADWIRTWYERQSRANGDSLVFTIWDLRTMTPIGNAALQDIDARTRTAEFGIFIADPAHRGEGRGTEATRLLLGFAFDTLSLENIMLRVYDYNERAQKVYEKVGFRLIGRRRGAQRRRGRAWDTLLMDITPEDFIACNPDFYADDVVLKHTGRR